VRIVKRADGYAPGFAWENTEVSLYLSSPVLSGGRLYGLSHRKKGQFFCLDARTGRTLWLSDGRQGESAALLVAGDHLLLFSTEGRLTVIERGAAAFTPLATYTLTDGEAWAHPALAGGQLLVKGADSLTLWRLS
jgi:outer membrane protein assembly factor BamB